MYVYTEYEVETLPSDTINGGEPKQQYELFRSR
jgi:hypothetical protein